jgi:hypothetical protein
MVFIPSGNKDVRAKIRIKSKKAFTLQSKINRPVRRLVTHDWRMGGQAY